MWGLATRIRLLSLYVVLFFLNKCNKVANNSFPIMNKSRFLLSLYEYSTSFLVLEFAILVFILHTLINKIKLFFL